MRILTVRQPWAWAIIHAQKDVENRVRNIAGTYRGPVAIHVAQTWDGSAYAAMNRTPALREAIRRAGALVSVEHFNELEFDVMDGQRGAIIGVVDLVGTHAAHPDCPLESEWAEPVGWHLELRNPRPLSEPIPFRGALGLRRLDDATRLLIESELA